ncbi:MAG: ZIP family metal transporter [Thermoplasmatota archaeon]
MEPWIPALLAVAVVSLLSLVGALSLSFGALRRHSVAIALVALAAGTLLGDVALHILPEATAASGGFTSRLGGYLLGGFVLLFVLEVVLRARHSHAEHIDDPHHDHADTEHIQPFGWLNLIGDGLHNLLDGVAIAVSFLVSIPVGVATTIAVALHEIPQELGDFAVLVRSGMKPARALLLNLASALLAVFGAILVFLIDLDPHEIEQVALPLVAGAFIYIAAADLIPELHHHNRGRAAVVILLAFLAGLALMFGLVAMEGVLFEATGEAGHGHGHVH